MMFTESEMFTAFMEDARTMAREIPVPETDPLPAYLLQAQALSAEVKTTFDNVRFELAKIDDVRYRLIRLAALGFMAFAESYNVNVDLISYKGMVSTEEAAKLFTQIVGKPYGKAAISLMVRSKELKVVARERIADTGRPSNFFRKKDVIEAARRRAE